MSVAQLIEWVAAREALRKKKESGALPPWTEDEILQTYRFCNVRRRDDRVSRWLRHHVLTEANLTLSKPNFIMFTALCRWINWPPMIGRILGSGLFPHAKIDWQRMVRVMDAYRAEGNKSWTGAYMINAKGCPKGQSKAWFVVQWPISLALEGALPRLNIALKTHSRREVWLTLNGLMNWGPFMSGQVVDDWGWTSLLAGAKDEFTWAPQGPGSIRGFNRVLGLEPLRKRHKEDEWCARLQEWRGEIISTLGPEYQDLTLHDTQSCLCEFDKYERVRLGQGTPRSKYRPETAY